jgi:fructan beta-fructosidase
MTETVWLDHGSDFYAGVTWSNVPDDRRILLAWMSNWAYALDVPTSP